MPLNRLLDQVSDKPWALAPEVLDAWCQILETKLVADKAEPPAEAKAKPQAQPEARPLEIKNGVAIVPVEGTLVKRAFLFDCGSSYAGIRKDVQAALDDPRAGAILLKIDSPGGSVDGVQELEDFLTAAAKLKPLYAFADGQATSAAYWLASTARKIAAPPTAQVGSIGVLSVHVDRSSLDEKVGVKRTFLTAGVYKAAGNDAAPLADTDRAYLQERLDQLYDLFLSAVQTNRKVSRDKAQAMAGGKVFLAGPAKEVGLIDMVMGLDQFMTRIKEDLRMDMTELKAQHPQLVETINTEARQGYVAAAEVETQVSAAATAERTRILALAAGLMGEEAGAKFKAAVEGGLTAESAKALGVTLVAGSAKQEEMLDALHKAHGEGVGPAKVEGQGSDKGFLALVKDHQAQHNTSRAAAVIAMAKAHPEAYEAYLAAAKPAGGKE